MWETRLIDGVPTRQCPYCGATFVFITEARNHSNQWVRKCRQRPIQGSLPDERKPNPPEGLDNRLTR